MTEEINFSYDGGLYAELVRNRSFKDDPKDPVHWTPVQPTGASGAIALDPSQPFNDAIATSLRSFDQATERHRKRRPAPAPATPRDRGWKREDLYRRGRSR
jgi:hypothetical protein